MKVNIYLVFSSFFMLINIGYLPLASAQNRPPQTPNQPLVIVENGYLRRMSSLKILVAKSSIAKKISYLNDSVLNEDWNEIKNSVSELEKFTIENQERLYKKFTNEVAEFEQRASLIIKKLTLLIKKADLLSQDQDSLNENYKRKLSTYDTLLSALNRIANESGKIEEARLAKKQSASYLESAQKLFTENKIQLALEKLDSCLKIIKEAIIKIKNGQTVIFSPENLSPDELASYEKHKNEEFYVLFETVTFNKKLNESLQARADKWATQAMDLKKKATLQFQQKNWIESAKNFQMSTEILNRVLKLYGISVGF